jgi:hypothetical protein
MLLSKLLADPKNVMMPTRPVEKPADCPYCGTNLNVVGSTNGAVPQPGDVTVCFRCAGLCQFSPTMEVLAIQFEDLDPDEDYRDRVREVLAVVKNATGIVVLDGAEGEA